jgi:hypothetical protein
VKKRNRIERKRTELTFSTNSARNKGLVSQRKSEVMVNNRKQGLYIDQSLV